MTKTLYDKPTTKPGRVSLRVGDFDDLLDNQGTNVRITPSIICPNRSGVENDEASVNHPMDCSICNGNQILDVESLAFNTWAFISGIKIETQIDQNRFDVKDALMTTKGDVKVHYWYKVEVVDHTAQFNQLIKRSLAEHDTVRYEPRDVSDGAIYCLVDSQGVAYTRDVDYSILGKRLTWLTATRPSPDSIYSFMYPVLPTFRVIDLMHENRYYYNSEKIAKKVPVNLPQQSHIRWDYMAKNVEVD
jgi:hypothetical protein